ncbi:MAG: DUF4097 family beta strand repeat-containing protein [Elusimicrobia bacterium]|nr:DUF4097 family beta strand repeat-containing protein [Elusimicrobiota bacterium]
MLGLLLAFPALLACAQMPLEPPEITPFQKAPVTKEFPSLGLKAIELRVSNGIIAIARADTDRVQVTVTPKRFPKICALTIDVKNGRLLVHAREGRKTYYGVSLGVDSCTADVTVTTPQHLSLDIATAAGAVAAEGMTGAVLFHSRRGSLRLKRCDGPLDAQLRPGPLEAKAGPGSIEADGLRDEARVRSGSGKVALSFLELPASGAIHVETGKGDVSLTFPADARAHYLLRSKSGHIQNAFADDPAGALRVEAKTGSGNITVEKQR